MNLYDLKPGDKLRTTDGALVEVAKPTQDGQWILVRYVADTADAGLIGTEDLCSEDELAELARLAG